MDLTIRVADQPSVMPVRIEPVYLKTSAVFLTAPTAAALYIENVHVGSMTLAYRHSLRRCRTLFENVIVNRIYSPERFPRYIRARHPDSKCFFHAYHQFEGIDLIQAKPFWTEKWQVVTDLLRGDLQHQILDQHFLDLCAQIGLRHK